jgi:hypothetical protein
MTRAVTVVTRTIRSTPHRSASDTWDLIVQLIAPSAASDARRELARVTGVACSCIADESLATDPIVVYGAGPRVRVRALYGDEAIEGDAANESPLSFVPTDGDWRMSIPCNADDLAWVQRQLLATSTRVSARALGEAVPDTDDDHGDSGRASIVGPPSEPASEFDHDAFFRR